MSSKTLYYVAAFVGSLVGGFIPTLWGAGFLSIVSLIFSTIGAILGIVLVYKTTS
jgi:uncharacterized membrane protein YeaQ/YmgE (transglycosylase-associated protein family)